MADVIVTPYISSSNVGDAPVGKISRNDKTGYVHSWKRGGIEVFQFPNHMKGTWAEGAIAFRSRTLTLQDSLEYRDCINVALAVLEKINQRAGEKLGTCPTINAK